MMANGNENMIITMDDHYQYDMITIIMIIIIIIIISKDNLYQIMETT